MQTTETDQVLAAFLALSLRHKANIADDGKESKWELLGYVSEFGKVKESIEGIKDVLPEMADLKPDEVPALAERLSAILNAWGVSHKKQDITTEVVKGIVDLIPVAQEFKRRLDYILNMPPVAEVVE